jgi:hypothetical protein
MNKVAKIFLAFVGILVLVSGILSFAGFYFFNQLKQHIVKQFAGEETAQHLTENIGTFKVPPGFEERHTSPGFPFFRRNPGVSMVLLTNRSDNTIIVLMGGNRLHKTAHFAKETRKTPSSKYCKKPVMIPYDTFIVKGKRLFFQRFTCKEESIERPRQFEFGYFLVEKPMPHWIELTASGNGERWDTKPIHSLVKSF